jgi:hypothetical protein
MLDHVARVDDVEGRVREVRVEKASDEDLEAQRAGEGRGIGADFDPLRVETAFARNPKEGSIGTADVEQPPTREVPQDAVDALLEPRMRGRSDSPGLAACV